MTLDPEEERRRREAAKYLAAMFVAVYLVLAIIMVFAVPPFERLYHEAGFFIPTLTKITLAASHLFRFFDLSPSPYLTMILHIPIFSVFARGIYRVLLPWMLSGAVESRRFIRIMEPTLIVVMGVLMGFIVLSLFLPESVCIPRGIKA